MEYKLASDHDQTAEIERMIGEETDPRVRVQLLMMYKLTSAVTSMGENVSDLDRKFSLHINDDNALVNQIKGAWKVIAWVLGVAQVLVVWVYLDLRTDVRSLAEAQHRDTVQHEHVMGRIEALEKNSK